MAKKNTTPEPQPEPRRTVYTDEANRGANPLIQTTRRVGARTYVDTTGLAGDANDNYHRAYPVWDEVIPADERTEAQERFVDSPEGFEASKSDAYQA